MRHIAFYLFCLSAIAAFAKPAAYDPLNVIDQPEPVVLDLTVDDVHRQRQLPIRVYLPADTHPAAVVLFSHGLGGSCKNNPYLGNHWAKRGYVAVFVQHPGSDISVWKDVSLKDRLAAMNKAANAQNYLLRVEDIPAVLDQLEIWNAEEGHKLFGRLDMKYIGMSGHSFGAVTTQAVSGAANRRGKQLFTDARIDAAVAFSPSTPKGTDAKTAFAKVSIPWMLMTGTKDLSVIGDADMTSRLAVFEALPPKDKYEVVLYNAEHSAFGDRALPGDNETRNPNHHKVILALSTAFWDTYLKHDAASKEWLNSPAPKSIMEEKDRWQTK